MKVPKYVPESADLLADREAEMWSCLSTAQEHSDYQDLRKDCCAESGGSHEIVGPGCSRIGVPESYSHRYDARMGA